MQPTRRHSRTMTRLRSHSTPVPYVDMPMGIPRQAATPAGEESSGREEEEDEDLMQMSFDNSHQGPPSPRSRRQDGSGLGNYAASSSGGQKSKMDIGFLVSN